MNHTFELIPLSIETRGEVISSNAEEFRDLVREAMANINRDLKTDEEFGQAEKDVKALKSAEDAVKAAKEKALADAEALHHLFSVLDETTDEIRTPRLELEKLIDKRKKEVRAELVANALAKLECADRHKKPIFGTRIENALKGKRTFDSMAKSLEIEILTINGTVEKNRRAIAAFAKAHGMELVMDHEDLEVKTVDSVDAELRRRLEAKTAAEEKKRLEKEAADARAAEAKAKAEAAAATAATAKPAATEEPDPFQATPKATTPAAESATDEEESPFAEWKTFKAACFTALTALKPARAALKDAGNVEAAAAFAAKINQAWKETF